MITRTFIGLSVIAAASLVGCKESSSTGAAAGALAAEATPARLPTTSGEIATHNFEAELAQAERQHQEQPKSVPLTRALIDHLLTRAQFFGRLDSYDRMETLARSAVALAPSSGDAHLLLARVDSALHVFPAALAEAERGAQLGADADAAQKIRVGVWQATGRVDEALVYLRAWRRDRPGLTSFAAEAAAYVEKRDFARAQAAFAEARRHYGDVSPFAVGWLEFQEGHMWETAGRSDLAQPLFQAAVGRLPRYAAAAAHQARILAAFGDPTELQRAQELLEPLVSGTDDPEYAGQLGAVYRQLGRGSEGEKLIARAARGYDRLLARHPQAFYDHAARFFLHAGGDPARARSLAEKNLALRPTADARDLYEEAVRATATTALKHDSAPRQSPGGI